VGELQCNRFWSIFICVIDIEYSTAAPDEWVRNEKVESEKGNKAYRATGGVEVGFVGVGWSWVE
jgi:hypothetical protein